MEQYKPCPHNSNRQSCHPLTVVLLPALAWSKPRSTDPVTKDCRKSPHSQSTVTRHLQVNNFDSRIRAAPVLRPPLANHFCSRIRIVYLYSFLSLTHFTSPFMLSTNIKLEISIIPHVGPHPILQPTGYFSSIFTHNCAPLQIALYPTNLDLICPNSWRVLCCRLSFISQTWI